jgi:hypothetical protein
VSSKLFRSASLLPATFLDAGVVLGVALDAWLRVLVVFTFFVYGFASLLVLVLGVASLSLSTSMFSSDCCKRFRVIDSMISTWSESSEKRTKTRRGYESKLRHLRTPKLFEAN